MLQVVGPALAPDRDKFEVPNEHHVDGALAADEADRAHVGAHGRVHPRDAFFRAFAQSGTVVHAFLCVVAPNTARSIRDRELI